MPAFGLFIKHELFLALISEIHLISVTTPTVVCSNDFRYNYFSGDFTVCNCLYSIVYGAQYGLTESEDIKKNGKNTEL